jgi:two-component system chemotaxis sensor kinase CheA
MIKSIDTDPLAQFKSTFFEECAELIADLDQLLSEFVVGEYDDEIVNTIFRAVHSMKAGAMAFNFKALISFSEIYESLLDEVRNQKLPVGEGDVSLFIQSTDVLSDLVDAARGEKQIKSNFSSKTNLALEKRLREYQDNAEKSQEYNLQNPESKNLVEGGFERRVQIKFRPRASMFRNANEPLLIFRELNDLGTLEVVADTSELPDLINLEPEDSYLNWDLTLTTNAKMMAIEEAFEFVVDDCDLVINDDQTMDIFQTIGDGDDDDGFGLFVDEPDIPFIENIGVKNGEGAEAILTPVLEDLPTEPVIKAGEADQKSAKEDGATSIRVDLKRIDDLVNMVGEIVINHSMLVGQLKKSRNSDDIRRILLNFEKLTQSTRDLQEGVMGVRMQPLKTIFSRMRRLVRDLSGELNKDVKLLIKGENSEVDRSLIEKLIDPLTHMIRNAMDHGIESPDERISLGKPAKGIITISAQYHGGMVVISMTDDGRGLERDKIYQKGLDLGLISKDEYLAGEEVDNLIFEPGFSTTSKVSKVSGRGVGMDVVRQSITNLGGRIHLRSKKGQGTEITLTLPLTLAVMDGMVVNAGEQQYIIPLTNITESCELPESAIFTLDTGAQICNHRDNYVRLISLAKVFDIPQSQTDSSNNIAVFVETEVGATIGILVDGLGGQLEVVIKSLQNNFQNVDGVSSATILGNGRVCLILDVDGLLTLEQGSNRVIKISDIENIQNSMPSLMPAGNGLMALDPNLEEKERLS